MKVILQSSVKKLGNKGDLIDVAEGYARNFLIPRGLAVVANDANVKSLKATKSQAKARVEREESIARELAEKLEKLTVKISAKTGESGRLFGSVTAGDIVDAVKKTAGYDVDKRKVELAEPIKALGTYEVAVGVHPGVTATLRVHVTEAQGEPK